MSSESERFPRPVCGQLPHARPKRRYY